MMLKLKTFCFAICAAMLQSAALPSLASAQSSGLTLSCEPNTCDVTSAPTGTTHFQWLVSPQGPTQLQLYSGCVNGDYSCTFICQPKVMVSVTAQALDANNQVLATASHSAACNPYIP